MDMNNLASLLLLAALLWFWLDSLRAIEVARDGAKRACMRANVQFLDDTVANIALAMVRDRYGRRVLRRKYRFEFSETGNSRLEGSLVLLGNKIAEITLEPYRILD